MIDASHIKGGLWQGSYPHPDDGKEFGKRFDSIIFAAPSDHWPRGDHFKPADCYRIGLTDPHGMSETEALRILDAAHFVAALLDDKQKVLVTCRQGANRSGVVVAAVLMLKWNMTATEAIRTVRKGRGLIPARDPNGKYGDDWTWHGRRQPALYNEDYTDWLKHDFDEDLKLWIDKGLDRGRIGDLYDSHGNRMHIIA